MILKFLSCLGATDPLIIHHCRTETKADQMHGSAILLLQWTAVKGSLCSLQAVEFYFFTSRAMPRCLIKSMARYQKTGNSSEGIYDPFTISTHIMNIRRHSICAKKQISFIIMKKSACVYSRIIIITTRDTLN